MFEFTSPLGDQRERHKTGALVASSAVRVGPCRSSGPCRALPWCLKRSKARLHASKKDLYRLFGPKQAARVWPNRKGMRWHVSELDSMTWCQCFSMSGSIWDPTLTRPVTPFSWTCSATAPHWHSTGSPAVGHGDLRRSIDLGSSFRDLFIPGPWSQTDRLDKQRLNQVTIQRAWWMSPFVYRGYAWICYAVVVFFSRVPGTANPSTCHISHSVHMAWLFRPPFRARAWLFQVQQSKDVDAIVASWRESWMADVPS